MGLHALQEYFTSLAIAMARPATAMARAINAMARPIGAIARPGTVIAPSVIRVVGRRVTLNALAITTATQSISLAGPVVVIAGLGRTATRSAIRVAQRSTCLTRPTPSITASNILTARA